MILREKWSVTTQTCVGEFLISSSGLSKTGIETPVDILSARHCKSFEYGVVQRVVVRIARAKAADFALIKHLLKLLKY